MNNCAYNDKYVMIIDKIDTRRQINQKKQWSCRQWLIMLIFVTCSVGK